MPAAGAAGIVVLRWLSEARLTTNVRPQLISDSEGTQKPLKLPDLGLVNAMATAECFDTDRFFGGRIIRTWQFAMAAGVRWTMSFP
ncbi:hypothetical protein EDE05_10496 [Neorhizobium sp. R1-B]|nr:hypothetical protein EDE09_103309 [Neorhizobium sp. S3-V5DH]TDX85513.1 hypothetical protein EDE05_10496 [Neorhizobium sp. R1-B]